MQYCEIVYTPIENIHIVTVYSTNNNSGPIQWQKTGLAIDEQWQFGHHCWTPIVEQSSLSAKGEA